MLLVFVLWRVFFGFGFVCCGGVGGGVEGWVVVDVGGKRWFWCGGEVRVGGGV